MIRYLGFTLVLSFATGISFQLCAETHRYGLSIEHLVDQADRVCVGVVSSRVEQRVMVRVDGAGKTPALERSAVFEPRRALKGKLPSTVHRVWKVEPGAAGRDPLPEQDAQVVLFLRKGRLLALLALRPGASWGGRAYSSKFEVLRGKQILTAVENRVRLKKRPVALDASHYFLDAQRGFLRYRLPMESDISRALLRDPFGIAIQGKLKQTSFLILPPDEALLPGLLRSSYSDSPWDRTRAVVRLSNYRTPKVKSRLTELLSDTATVTLKDWLLIDGKSRGDRDVLAVSVTAADVLRSWGDTSDLPRDPRFPPFYMDYAFPTRGRDQFFVYFPESR